MNKFSVSFDRKKRPSLMINGKRQKPKGESSFGVEKNLLTGVPLTDLPKGLEIFPHEEVAPGTISQGRVPYFITALSRERAQVHFFHGCCAHCWRGAVGLPLHMEVVHRVLHKISDSKVFDILFGETDDSGEMVVHQFGMECKARTLDEVISAADKLVDLLMTEVDRFETHAGELVNDELAKL